MMTPESPPPKEPSQVVPKTRLEETQQQVNDVVDIMKTNVERIMEREEKLTELDQRASNLTISASEFQTTSRKLKKKYWWKNIKMILIMGCIGTLILVIIIIGIVGVPSSSGGGGGDKPTSAPITFPPVTTTTPNAGTTNA